MNYEFLKYFFKIEKNPAVLERTLPSAAPTPLPSNLYRGLTASSIDLFGEKFFKNPTFWDGCTTPHDNTGQLTD